MKKSVEGVEVVEIVWFGGCYFNASYCDCDCDCDLLKAFEGIEIIWFGE